MPSLFDANGNVTGYIDDAGNVFARYEYSPFGKIISSSGSKVDDFKFRFSTKYLDETGLSYYGLRFYSPELGRWISRDPVEEEGGLNVYAFVGNDGVDKTDSKGETAFDALKKLRNRAVKKAVGIETRLTTRIGLGVNPGGSIMFFPDTCEIAAYWIGPAILITGDQRTIRQGLTTDTPAGIDTSAVSLSLTSAQYLGSGVANSRSWEGVFYGGYGGASAAGLLGISIGAYWSPGFDWIGGELGVTVGPPTPIPVSAGTNPSAYFRAWTYDLDDDPATGAGRAAGLCACIALTHKMP